ncbi:3-keto-disaccharide hydrolase [Luteolibacter pohnpeiensis]|uniref:3-keto-disaccharide hydrolase n=1 Tax=Luteolibacter pohnpeiensis TaxID=454153 RepID=UPI001903CA55|nr:DUF1080 domain-containing protein [Luteolibacter pohnpeiensis]
MTHTVLLFAASMMLLPAESINQLSTAEKKAGWKLLFNGKDLKNWRIYGSEKPPGPGWKIEDGILKKLAMIPGGSIITTDEFTDFELSWEWSITPGGNNGIKYLVTEKRPSAPGPEYQMLDDAVHPDGKLGTDRQTAALYDIIPPAADKTLKPVGEWNQSRIIVRGNQVEHWLNGKKVVSYTLGSDELKAAISKSKFKDQKDFAEKISGHIMLTDHGDACSFRNLKIRAIEP